MKQIFFLEHLCFLCDSMNARNLISTLTVIKEQLLFRCEGFKWLGHGGFALPSWTELVPAHAESCPTLWPHENVCFVHILNVYYNGLKYIKNNTLQRNKASFEYESGLFVYRRQSILVCEGCCN